MSNEDERYATEKNRSEEYHHSWEQTVRDAKSILDPDDAPRALFVGLFHENGTDYTIGVNETLVEPKDVERARVEVLAAQIEATAEESQYDAETLTEWALDVLREDDDDL